MNIQDRIEALKHFPREPRDIIIEDDPDFLAWRAVLPPSFDRAAARDYSNSGPPTLRDYFRAFKLWLNVTDAGMRDYWRFLRYLGRRQLRPAHELKGAAPPKYPLTVEGFLNFLENEPGRTIPAVAGAVAGFAIGGPTGAAAGYGAARGAQRADQAGKSVVGGAALGGLAGYGAAAAAIAPVVGVALPAAAAPAGKVGRGLSKLGPKRYTPAANVVRPSSGIDMAGYPPKYARMLNALIAVESSGNPNAVSPGKGTYVGLLQMGPLAAQDIGLDNYKGALMGNAEAAIDAFWKYQTLYKDRTMGHPFLMALLWKGGPGTLRQFKSLVQSGATITQALKAVPTSNVYQYMSRFAKQWNAQG